MTGISYIWHLGIIYHSFVSIYETLVEENIKQRENRKFFGYSFSPSKVVFSCEEFDTVHG